MLTVGARKRTLKELQSNAPQPALGWARFLLISCSTPLPHPSVKVDDDRRLCYSAHTDIYAWGCVVGVVTGDLVQLTDRQAFLGQTCLNVYYYRYIVITPATNDIYPALVSEWMENVLPAILDIQHPVLNHNLIEVRNLSNGIDIYQLPIDEDGTAASPGDDVLPSYASVGFQLNRESLVTRNGYKRFAGIPEDHTNGNTWNLYGGPQSDELELQLAATQFISAVETFEPVIVKRPYVVPVGTSYDYSSIGSASAKQYLGTQNTRKAGRGI